MKIILGTANFNTNYGVLKNKMQKKDFIEILNICENNGIKKIDTALGYKDFSKIINIKKKNWEIFTKVKISKKPYEKELEKTFKNYPNCQVNVLLHNTSDLNNKNFKNFIIKIQERKNVKVGISVYDAQEIFESYKKIKFSFVQAPGNLFDNRIILNSKIKNFLKSNKIKLLIRSVFLQGILCLDESLILEKFEALSEPIKKIKKIFGNKKNIIKKLTLQWIASNKIVDGYVLGVNNKIQLIENIKIVKNFQLKKSDREKLLKLIKTFEIPEKVVNPTKW
tara:strand:+ start:1909 stop:2748 length:840 start_codon:yes stop_codon:yes gene_type:complete